MTGNIDWPAAYATYAPHLVRYLRRLTRSEEEAQDLVQETFVKAIQSGSGLREHGSLRPWLYRIATNLAAERRRRARLVSFVPFLGSEPAPERATETDALIRLALRAIPHDQAVALVLAYHEGFARSEISDLLGVPEETVKTRIHRGRRHFAKAYERLERGGS
ncbi:MAG: RNA polymerase sigma factor [Candidatus Limnocylindria bacterium]